MANTMGRTAVVELQSTGGEESMLNADDGLFNADLAPVPKAQRTWGSYDFASLWIAMTHQVPTYMAASGLMAIGMSWWQAILTVAVANLIILIPILLNSHVGSKYGIPFPVVARASYGVQGANLPALMRAFVACGWFGVQAWVGGQAVNGLLTAIFHSWATFGGTIGGQSLGTWISFAIFWFLNVFIIYRGMETLRKFENWAGPSILVVFTLIFIALAVKAHGLGPILASSGNFRTFSSFLPVFGAGVTSMMGMWATLSLNIPDFTRFAKSHRQQLIGQSIALPSTMTLFAALGVLITSAGRIVYGKTIWDPVQLISQFHNRLFVIICMAAIVILTLSVNVAANVVSPANDFSNLKPKLISFKTGGLIAALIAIAIRPWVLLASPTGFIFTFLNGYGGGLGCIAGVMIADYWIVRRKQYDVAELYRYQGIYRYLRGWNWRGVLSTVVGSLVAWSGWWFPALQGLNNYAWFIGFGIGLFLHWGLNTLFPPQGADVYVGLGGKTA